MTKKLYLNFIQLLKEWPLEEYIKGRDVGVAIRNQVTKKFPQGEVSVIKSQEELEQMCRSWIRIANNTYSKKHPRLLNSTSTGLTVEQCDYYLKNYKPEN